MTQKIIMTLGLPGSGKSFWAENFILTAEKESWYNSNRDNLRFEMFSKYDISPQQEKRVTAEQEARINKSIDEGKSIIISDTNLNLKTQTRFELLAKKRKIQLEHKSFLDIPLETCIKQDLKRSRSVGKDVIMNMHIKYIRPNLYKHNANKEVMQAVIFDIDGTLAQMNGRSPYDYTKVDTDILDESVKMMFDFFHKKGIPIIFCSGRKASCYIETKVWLEKNLNIKIEQGTPYALFMRMEDDNRADYIVKREIFMEKIDQLYNIIAVFDDRNQVVNMWRDLGLKVFQVEDGLF